MTVIRRPQTGDGKIGGFLVQQLPMLVGAFFLGAITMYLCLDGGRHERGGRDTVLNEPIIQSPSTMTKSSFSSSKSIRTLQSSSSAAKAGAVEGGVTMMADMKDDGWHSINVYYGERSGLGAPETQESFAQVHQDDIVLDLLGPNGYFIDLAANDAKDLTNTLALERHGWKGLCVEPNPGYWYGLSHRSCTVVGALVGGTKQKVQVKFRGVFGGIVGKLDEKLANRKNEPEANLEDRYTAPILEVLERYQVPKTIDYMSLDVEGSEYEIMKDFPFDDYRIQVMTIERPSKQLKELLNSKGYIQLKRLAWWGETLWAHSSTGFTPEHPKISKIFTEERN